MSDTKPFTDSQRWLHRFRNRFGLKNIKITEEAVSANEEVAATFLTELRLIKERDNVPITFITVYCYNCSMLLLLLISYCA